MAYKAKHLRDRRTQAIGTDDFYSTPEIFTEWLLENEEFEEEIHEPCCGDGRMVKVLKAEGYHVIASDIKDYGYRPMRIRSVFDWPVMANVVTNPPYSIAEDIIDHCLNITGYKVCMLLRLNFLESAGRYHRFWKKRPPARIYVVSQRTSMMPAIMRANGRMRATNSISYAWFVWEKGMHRTELRWLRPK